METIEIFNRIVVPITTTEGQIDYYNHMNYWKSCVNSKNLRIKPTTVEVDEYLKLKEDKPAMSGNLSDRKKFRKLQEYENNYDWRPTKSGEPHFIGLVSPTGERLLPNILRMYLYSLTHCTMNKNWCRYRMGSDGVWLRWNRPLH